jgi:hypothetical protein
MNRRGNCYVASEALYHIMGGKKAGWTPMVMQYAGDTHWFLKHRQSGLIIDPSVRQFKKRPPYEFGRGTGFLTRKPSKRAVSLIERLTYA